MNNDFNEHNYTILNTKIKNFQIFVCILLLKGPTEFEQSRSVF